MGLVRWALGLSFCVLVLAGCSEGTITEPSAEAQVFIEQTAAQFPILQPLLKKAATLERVDGDYRSILPERLKQITQGAWRTPGPHQIKAEIPDRANGVMRLSSGPVTIEVRSLSARAVVASPGEKALVYKDAYPNADSFIIGEKEIVEEFIVLRDARAPRKFEYEVKVVRGGGRVLQSAGVVEVLDGAGIAWLRLERPYLVDEEGNRHQAEARLEGKRLVVSVPVGVRRGPVLLDPAWTTTTGMAVPRYSHTATLLTTDKILVAGGSSPYTSSAELYDQATGTWSLTGSMASVRRWHTATLLKTGKVLVAGGTSKDYALSSAELYDLSTGKWTSTGSMAEARKKQTATLLGSGKVLVVGGEESSAYSYALASAELYDPVTGKWGSTGSMAKRRTNHTATLLKTGKVLAAGGYEDFWWGSTPLSSAELYDPVTGKWAFTGSMANARYDHTASLLGPGSVLVTGGNNPPLSSAELYDPAVFKWTSTGSMAKARKKHTATLLKTDRILIAGGASDSSAELYDPTSGWTLTGSMAIARNGHTATLLKMGRVLVAGAGSPNAELYDPSLGLACKSASACLSGYCTDGVCCELPCMGLCKECVVKTVSQGTTGKCVYLGAGKPDPIGTYPCTGINACDGKGNCKLKKGQPCTNGSQCLTGYCADGTCCDSACTETCKACNITATKGTCSYIQAGKGDSNATIKCLDPSACDGKGQCQKSKSCTKASECLSGYCADGTCCDQACTETCKACDIYGSKGFCAFIPSGKTDANATIPCTGTKACDGKGACKLGKGQPSTSGSQCASGYSMDQVCCDSACTWTCMSCNIPGSKGTCSYVPAGKGDTNAATQCLDPGTCDGKGQCKKPKSCTTASECPSGYCVDGYCCATGCTETCKACNVYGGKGFCTFIPSGKSDANATVTCTGIKACDGKGVCKEANGQACPSGTPYPCASNYCVDYVCCDQACTETCKSCNIPGSAGTCNNIPMGKGDSNAAKTCLSPNACDGKGQCKETKKCTKASECASGYCVDGYCCDSACMDTCKSCKNIGYLGFCTNIPAEQPDPTATLPCTGTNACDGKGACKTAKGKKCLLDSDCVSGICIDGVCCTTKCTDQCKACNVPGSEGTCTLIPKGQPDAYPTGTCEGNQACDGKGNCKKASGQTCQKPGDCASGYCKDGFCCSTACDKPCESCAIKGSEGTCTFIPANTNPDNDCPGTDPDCGGKCDGAGKCDYPGIGKLCDTIKGPCRACDGYGVCKVMPQDDMKCTKNGVIDCDELDTTCHDYEDLKTNHCRTFGQCKKPNDPDTCKVFKDLCPGDGKAKKDLGPGQDQGGTTSGGEDEGCDCSLGRFRPDGTGHQFVLLAMFIFLGGVLRRRWLVGRNLK